MPAFDINAYRRSHGRVNRNQHLRGGSDPCLAKTGSVRIKADGSPVTAADEAAEAVIREGLTRLPPAFADRLGGAGGAREDRP